MKSKIFLVVISIFILIVLFKGHLFASKYVADDYTKEYTVFIQSLKSKSDTKVSYNVKLLGTQDKFIFNIYDNSYDNIQTDLTKYNNYEYGDVVKIKGKKSIPQKLNNPGEFNYKLYLYSNNIYGLINTYEEPIKIQYKLTFLERINSKIYEFKEYIQSIVQNSMNETNTNVAISMIYGDKTDLDENIKDNFETIGVSHLMSVSGTHITSFMLIINTLFKIKKKHSKTKDRSNTNSRKNRIGKILKGIIQIFCILVYIVFTGFSVSVLRAGIMLITSIIFNMLNKNKSKYMGLIIALMVILFLSPHAIFSTGMQLSFLASLGIIVFWKDVSKIFCKVTHNIQNEILKKILEYILENVAITVAVQLMIIPIQIESFNRLPFPIIMPNLILGIISIPIRILGTFGIMLSFIPTVSSKIFVITEVFVKWLIKAANIFKKFSFGINLVSMPVVFFVIYYLFIFTLGIYLKLKNVVSKSENTSLKSSLNKIIKRVKITVIALAICVSVFAILLNIYTMHISKHVYFFNVEQGDMSYIKYEKDSVIVDIGSMREGLAFNTISNYFKANNISEVDAIVISHMHKDHINGLEKLLEKYKVGEVIYTKPKESTENYTEFLKLLDKYSITKTQVKSGDKVNIGEIEINILLPDNKYIKSDDEENANSLICKIKINNKELLYMGDGSQETEEKLLKQNCDIENIDILKVGHHGSKTATSSKFIQRINPQNAVISALKKYYGHPHQNTIDTLKQNNVWIYLTEKQGAIKFSLY